MPPGNSQCLSSQGYVFSLLVVAEGIKAALEVMLVPCTCQKWWACGWVPTPGRNKEHALNLCHHHSKGGMNHTHSADTKTESAVRYVSQSPWLSPLMNLGRGRLQGQEGVAHTAASSFLSASRRLSSPSPVKQDSSRCGGRSRRGSGSPGGSRSDLFSTSRRRCLFPLGLSAPAGLTTMSRKLQLDGEARSEASSTARMRSACSSLEEQREPTEQ